MKTFRESSVIYTIGHSNPDVDSVVSSSLMASILSYLGVPAHCAVLEHKNKMDEETIKMLKDCVLDPPVILSEDEIEKQVFYLVDHNDTRQSVGREAIIYGGIDHHKAPSFLSERFSIYSTCATALAIYEKYKEIYPFSEQEKWQIFLAFLQDSNFGRSSRYREEDEKIVQELGFQGPYDQDFEKYFVKTSFQKGLEEAFHHDLKMVRANGIFFSSSSLDVLDDTYQKAYQQFVKEYPTPFLGVWNNYQNNTTDAYFQYHGKMIGFHYPYLASRSTTITNDIKTLVLKK